MRAAVACNVSQYSIENSNNIRLGVKRKMDSNNFTHLGPPIEAIARQQAAGQSPQLSGSL